MKKDVTILNVYAPNSFRIHEAKLTELKGKNRQVHKRVVKIIEQNAIKERNLTDIYRMFCPTDCTFFSCKYVTFTKIGHILGHKTN